MLTGLPNLPAETLIAYLGVFVGTVVASVLWYRKNYRDVAPARKVAEDLVLTSGVIGDMAPVRKSADALERIANLMPEMVEEQVRLRHAVEDMVKQMQINAAVDQATRRRGDFS